MKKTKLSHFGPPLRFDVFITGAGLGYSRSFAKRLIEEGLATVNGERRKPSFMLSDGNSVEISAPGEATPAAAFSDLVIFEDESLLAVHKPAGIAVHPNSANWESNPKVALLGEPTLVSLLYCARPEMAQTGMDRLGLVHRLDRDTSGLMLLAKNQQTQEALKEGFRERLMQKTYLGAVSGIPRKTGVINAPIGRASGFKKIKVWEYGRDALTEYSVKEKGKECSLLEIRPKTGRTNQIRIHLAHIGHPIIGDKLYGGAPAARMLLHSLSLEFTHPATGRATRLQAPPPQDFLRTWKTFKKR